MAIQLAALAAPFIAAGKVAAGTALTAGSAAVQGATTLGSLGFAAADAAMAIPGVTTAGKAVGALGKLSSVAGLLSPPMAGGAVMSQGPTPYTPRRQAPGPGMIADAESGEARPKDFNDYFQEALNDAKFS
jgi:hypothetical protein